MLESLHVKNLALIDEVEVIFKEGLNILTGETGAGKSIIIGSVNLALGAKADKELIRTGAEYALVEIVFRLNKRQCDAVKEMDLPVEDENILLLQRKIMTSRSQCRVNGESVSAGQLKSLADILLDMYGQHEHQTLLKTSTHKTLLDDYAGAEMKSLKEKLKAAYGAFREAEEALSLNQMDESARIKENELLSFEINEIEAASLKEGEDGQAEKSYRKMVNSRRIRETVYSIHGLTGYEEESSAGSILGRALKELKNVSQYDEALDPMKEQITEIDGLLNDFNRSMADYIGSLEFNEEEFNLLEERLNLINHLKNKYGSSIKGILEELELKRKRFDELNHFEEFLHTMSVKTDSLKSEALSLCALISEKRKKAAGMLSKKLKDAMIDLNFMDVSFKIEVTPELEVLSYDGYDNVEYLISTNPGEAMRPLKQIASGGELSRIMLAFKTVFAVRDETDTLVFDEIDTGISGKTAWKVSEKLGLLGKMHQIICITHLPQIAAMADEHYLIEKTVDSNRAVTNIRLLKENESLSELARLLGSGNLSEAALENAKEMKQMAGQFKK